MIQYFGLHLDATAATAVILARDLHESARVTASVMNVSRDATTGIVEVPTGEWVRAGAYALQEAYFKLPVADRQAWGLGLSGPSGWIVLDVMFEPISPLRLTGDSPWVTDLHRWLEANPRLRKKIGVILSPKDYFRFAISGSLAVDLTTASRCGWLVAGKTDWSPELVTGAGLDPGWLPPVFDPPIKTGRLSEEGIRRTTLPGGFWLVAGAHEEEAGAVTAGDLRDGRLWQLTWPGGERRNVLALRGATPAEAPAGWSLTRSAWPGFSLLARKPGCSPAEARAELAAVGVVPGPDADGGADPALGAAVIAGLGSGLLRDWERYYQWRSPTA